MDSTCHRCAALISNDAAFCPHCGAPQVRVTVAAPNEAEANLAAAATAVAAAVSPRAIQWRRALLPVLLPSALVAIVMQLPYLNLAFLLWIALAAAWSCSLYSRRVPTAILDAGVGARLGAVTGVFAFLFEIILLGIALGVDAVSGHGELRSALQQQLRAAAQSNPNPAATDFYNKLVSSPEALAMFLAVVLVIMFVGFIVFGTIGGALRGASLAHRRPK
jgi:hypothetical protein